VKANPNKKDQILPLNETVDSFQVDLLHLNETLRRTQKTLKPLVENPLRRETPKNSFQTQEQRKNKKESENAQFNELQQLPTSSGQKGREILLNQSATRYKYSGQ